MKNLLFTAMMMLLSLTASAQTLERMQWFNEPDNWKISNNKLAMQVTPPERLLAYLSLWVYRR